MMGTAMDEYARIGERLRSAREALGYTQQRLADEIGVAASTYSRYEAGVQKITIPELRKVAALLGIPLEAAIGGPGPDNPLLGDVADRVADKLAERLPAIVRAILTEQTAQAGHHGGGPRRQGLLNTDENDEAILTRRPAWPVLAVAG